MKTIINTLGTVIIAIYISLGIYNVTTIHNKIEFQKTEIKGRTSEILELNIKYDALNERLGESKNLSDSQLKELQDEKAKLDAEKARIEAEQKAALERQQQEELARANAAKTAINAVTGTHTAYASSGSAKEQWMAAAGIPQSQWQYVDYIVGEESGWDPCAYNPMKSDCSASPTSACGLAQSLPCGKQSKYGHWTDPVANLKWQYEYVTERYGGYAQAYNFWVANRWY